MGFLRRPSEHGIPGPDDHERDVGDLASHPLAGGGAKGTVAGGHDDGNRRASVPSGPSLPRSCTDRARTSPETKRSVIDRPRLGVSPTTSTSGLSILRLDRGCRL